MLLLGGAGRRGILVSGSTPGVVDRNRFYSFQLTREHGGRARLKVGGKQLTFVAHFPPLEVERCVVVGLDGHVELDGQNGLTVHFARAEQVHSEHWRVTRALAFALCYDKESAKMKNTHTNTHRLQEKKNL